MIAPMIKTIIVLLNFAFKCRPVKETRMIALWQARGKPIGQRNWPAGNIRNFIENHAGKSLFFSQDSKEMRSLIFASVIKKVYQENIPFVKTIHMYVFIKGIIRKMNCYWHVSNLVIKYNIRLNININILY